jgi:hypothetical protein
MNFTETDWSYTEKACHYLIAVSNTPATKDWWVPFLRAARELVQKKQIEEPQVLLFIYNYPSQF